MKSEIIVVYIGPAAAVPGGISSLQEKITSHLPPHINVTRVATCSAYTGYDNSYKFSIVQFFVFLRSLIAVSLFAVLHPRAIFHVHLAQGGSTLRKGTVCILLRLLGRTYVVHAHADAGFHRWVPTMVRRVLWWGIGGAQYVITLTQLWRDYYASKLEVPSFKLLVLPNPAVLPQFRSRRQDCERSKILFLGRVGERKGIFDLIQAMAALPADVRPLCHLTVAGDGDLNAASSLVERLGCFGQVSILGWVGRREVDLLLEESDILALPSYMEGMAMALLEAMAAGLAVVTSSAGGSDEFLTADRNCILVNPGDVQGIASVLARLARDPHLRERLGAEARTTAEHFSIDRYVAKLTCLYEDLANRTPESSRIQAEFASK